MLTTAAILLNAISAMHSELGRIILINHICYRPDPSIMLGSDRNTVPTLQFGSHFLSHVCVALADPLLCYNADIAAFAHLFFFGGAGLLMACGLTALVGGQERRLSRIVFFPIAGLFFVVVHGLR